MSDFPEIPVGPSVPVRSEGRVGFSRQASVFVSWLPTFRAALNDAGAWIQAALESIAQTLVDAVQARDDAQDYANDASGFADDSSNHALDSEQFAQQANAFAQVAATNAAFRGEWDELTGPIEMPASVYHDGAYWQLLRDLPDVTASEPGQTQDWAGTQTEIISWEPVTGNATLASNRYYGVNFSSGQVLTLPASPANNDIITLYKRSGNAAGAVLNRNGNTIMGLAENMNIDGDIVGLQLIYTGSDWRITR